MAFRYLAEFKTSAERKEAAESTLLAYKSAQVSHLLWKFRFGWVVHVSWRLSFYTSTYDHSFSSLSFPSSFHVKYLFFELQNRIYHFSLLFWRKLFPLCIVLTLNHFSICSCDMCPFFNNFVCYILLLNISWQFTIHVIYVGKCLLSQRCQISKYIFLLVAALLVSPHVLLCLLCYTYVVVDHWIASYLCDFSVLC